MSNSSTNHSGLELGDQIHITAQSLKIAPPIYGYFHPATPRIVVLSKSNTGKTQNAIVNSQQSVVYLKRTYRIYEYLLVFTSIYQYLQIFTSIYQDLLGFTGIYQSAHPANPQIIYADPPLFFPHRIPPKLFTNQHPPAPYSTCCIKIFPRWVLGTQEREDHGRWDGGPRAWRPRPLGPNSLGPMALGTRMKQNTKDFRLGKIGHLG